MSIFRRDPLSSPGAAAAAPRPSSGPAASGPGSLITAGARFEGVVSGAADLRVEGLLVGSVATEGVVRVAAGGEVEGGIAARTISIAGRVAGDVVASDLVELAASAKLEGNIAASRVVIAEGAFLSGQVTMAKVCQR